MYSTMLPQQLRILLFWSGYWEEFNVLGALGTASRNLPRLPKKKSCYMLVETGKVVDEKEEF